MNKYEQALKNLRAELRVSNSDIDILQELVNRATPNRVKQIEDHYFAETYDYDYTSGHCSCCGADVCCDETDVPNYCSNCGQKLLSVSTTSS